MKLQKAAAEQNDLRVKRTKANRPSLEEHNLCDCVTNMGTYEFYPRGLVLSHPSFLTRLHSQSTRFDRACVIYHALRAV